MFADFENNDTDEEYLDECRQKLNTSAVEAFEERKNEINRSKNVFVGTVSGIALAAVVGWFVLSPRYASDNNAEIPVVRRPQTAVKVQPSEPGGMEIQNQDKSVYDIIEKKTDKAPVVENLLPPPEEPQLPVVTAETVAPAPIEVGDSEIAKKAEEIIKEAEAKTAAPTEIKVAEVAPVVTVKEEASAPKEVTIKEVAVAPAPQAEPVKVAEVAPAPAPVKVEIKAEPVKAPTALVIAPETVASGSWQVQLISSPNRSAVDTAWTGLVKKYSVLKNQPYEIETADLGDKGTYYRLKAGAYAERSGADKLCNDIKALGGSCLVKKK